MIRRIGLVLAVFALLVACSNDKPTEAPSPSPPAGPAAVTPDQARATAKEAYIYGFPMVDNYRVLYSYFVNKDDPEYKGGWNEIHNTARVYTPEDKAIQTPNSDTPYSAVGADLRAEPLVLTVPPIEQDRYYSLQFVDGYTYNFAYVGSRTTGNGGGKYLLAGPNWKGDKPEGINEVIRSDTELAMVLYRTQLFGPSDLDSVKKIQAGYQVTPLSVFLNQPPPTPAPPIDFVPPLTPDQQKTSPQFFEILSFALRFAPTLPSEKDLRARFATIGIGPDGDFDSDKLSPEMRTAIEGGMAGRVGRVQHPEKGQDRHRRGGLGTVLRHGRGLEGQLSVPNGGRGAGHLRQHGGGSDLPELLQRLRRRTVDGGEQVRLPLRARPAAAGERLLVADHVRAAAEPAGGQPDEPLPDQFTDAAEPGRGPRRRLHLLRSERVARSGRGVQLVAGTVGTLRVGAAAVLAEARRPQRRLEGAAAGKGLTRLQTRTLARKLAAEAGAAAAQVALELGGQRVAVDLAERLVHVDLGVAAFLE